MEAQAKDKIAKSAGMVSSATFLSRIFGLIREQVFAYLFGAGMATDAFVAAFRIPNLLRDLLAEGALSSAFIPVFTEKLTLQGKEEAFRLVNLVLNILVIVLSAIVILGIIFSPSIVDLIAPGFDKIQVKTSQDKSDFSHRIAMPKSFSRIWLENSLIRRIWRKPSQDA